MSQLAPTADPATARRRGLLRFTRHYLEMIVAMVVGMLVLGAAIQGAAAVAGVDYSHERHPELGALEMALTMSAGMIAWMRFRKHGWTSTLEMTAAMAAPALAVIPLLWLDLISGDAAMAVMHIAMLPLMLVAMLRRRTEYTHHTPA